MLYIYVLERVWKDADDYNVYIVSAHDEDEARILASEYAEQTWPLVSNLCDCNEIGIPNTTTAHVIMRI